MDREKDHGRPVIVVSVLCKIQQRAGSREHREAIGRYEISHPVIVDMGTAIWQSCTVSSWPTIAVIDPIGNLFYQQSGDGQSENLDDVIDVLLERHKEQGTLAKEPLAIERPSSTAFTLLPSWTMSTGTSISISTSRIIFFFEPLPTTVIDQDAISVLHGGESLFCMGISSYPDVS